MTINERIRLILDREKVQNQDAAKWLGLGKSRLSQKFKDGIWDSVAELKAISDKTGYSLDWIITGKGSERSEQMWKNLPEKDVELSEAHETPITYGSEKLIEVMAAQAKTQSEYIELLKTKVSQLQEELTKYKTQKQPVSREVPGRGSRGGKA